MIVGSGNIVHNLGKVRFDLLGKSEPAAPWNVKFDADITQWVSQRNFEALSEYKSHPDSKLCVPTPDHFLPLLIVAGASDPDDEFNLITKASDGFSLSMTSFAFRPKGQGIKKDLLNGQITLITCIKY